MRVIYIEDDPAACWKALSNDQQRIVDHLNKCENIHYQGENIDIRFSTKGRIWINSDGKTNMPSGEVYTAPVEDSERYDSFFISIHFQR